MNTVQIGSPNSRILLRVRHDPLAKTYVKAFSLVLLGLVPAALLVISGIAQVPVPELLAFAGQYLVWRYLLSRNRAHVVPNSLIISAVTPLTWRLMTSSEIVFFPIDVAVLLLIIHWCVKSALLDAYRVFTRA